MADNSFSSTVASLFKGMDSFITTKTVVGDAVHIGDTIILPLVDVSFGVGAGAFSDEKEEQRRWRYGRKDHSKRCTCHPEWYHEISQCQKNQDGITKSLRYGS